jgi:hypothetical protein
MDSNLNRFCKFISLSIIAASVLFLSASMQIEKQPERLKISANHRYITTIDNKPFFWLGDTGWLLFSKLNREEAEKYLENRREKGFNVIQIMVLHDLKEVNVYGDSALIKHNITTPAATHGSSFSDQKRYDYWDHAAYIVDLAAKKGLYVALVPVWGSVVKSGKITPAQAKVYASFIGKKFANRTNVIWMNGGDIAGDQSMGVWKTIGTTLKTLNPTYLMTYHPRGRTTSSKWFHQEKWLDFNSFQSGHRRYDQDTSKGDLHYGEDNWKFVQVDYQKKPAKPTLDAEPSYEGIPQGLHDTLEVRWKAADVRRYGYWEVFAGACGYTYGDNAVMQFRKAGEKTGAYGARDYWFDAINDPGASQMIYLKKLMLSRPYLERVPDQTLIAGDAGEKYDHLVAMRGKTYAFIYTYNGRDFKVNLGKTEGVQIKASWYDPRNGQSTAIGTFKNTGVKAFDPPGEQKDGNDWVLILDKA